MKSSPTGGAKATPNGVAFFLLVCVNRKMLPTPDGVGILYRLGIDSDRRGKIKQNDTFLCYDIIRKSLDWRISNVSNSDQAVGEEV